MERARYGKGMEGRKGRGKIGIEFRGAATFTLRRIDAPGYLLLKVYAVCSTDDKDDVELVVADGGGFILSQCLCRTSTDRAIGTARHPQTAAETRRNSRLASADTRPAPLSL